MSMLRIKNVSHAFNDRVVARNVSLAVEPGELVCLLGPSGCGKTTLLRLAAGLETLQKGQIFIDGHIAADAGTGLHLAPEKRGVGLMFQDYALFPHLTLQENITFGLDKLTGKRRGWVETALKRIGMAESAGAYPHTLSGGQQQRAALLRAIAPSPRVLLLDEPFSGLDITLRVQVREQTLDLLRETGIATLMVTHDPEEAMFMADRILIMNEGRIVQAGTPLETYNHPDNAFVAALFGPVNRITGTVENGMVDTPLGVFEAKGMADGDKAEILIRPEGIHLAPAGEQAPGEPVAKVDFARLLGRSSHVRLHCSREVHGKDVYLEARIPGIFLPESGTPVLVKVDSRQAFVFPRP